MTNEASENANRADGALDECTWFVMRDLKRANTRQPAFRMLMSAGFEVFTPTKTMIFVRGGIKFKEERPIITDLLFVNSVRENLDKIVERTPTLQYRFVKGGKYGEVMTVRKADMERFISIVRSSQNTEYFSPEEVTPDMIGRRVRIVGGALDGHEGNLQAIRGARKKRLIVSLPDIITASVTVDKEFIEYIN